MDARTEAPAERRDSVLRVGLRGLALLADPLLNKGTCFTEEEREAFGLHGLLPPGVASEAEQEARAYGNFLRAGRDIDRYVFLSSLQDRNETLFYRLLVDHIEEMAPIVYTPTIGQVAEEYSHIFRRPRGLYVSSKDRGRIARVLRNTPRPETRVLVITDNEAVLGLGDLGVGGMGIVCGKLALYTAGGGLHPGYCLPLDLDVGTDNRTLLDDPLYLGVPHPRLRGEEYFSLLDELVEGIGKVFPGAPVQWEDFASRNAFAVLERYRHRLPSFNDDIQGTAAVVLAGIQSALRQAGRRLEDERIVFFGVGAAGGGSALLVKSALAAAGVNDREFRRRVLCIDSQGLVLADRPGLEGYLAELAADPALVSGWSGEQSKAFKLPDVVRNFRPTILVGASGQPGSFTEEIARAMRERCERPVFLPLSNPTSKAEARPGDLLRWTEGAAIVGTGSPFPPVQLGGVTHEIGQGNNVLVFPGLGLGAVAVEARELPEAAFLAAARALFEATPAASARGAPIYPPLRRLREISVSVAIAVGRTLIDAGVAPMRPPGEIEERVRALVWEPVYPRYVPI